MLGNSEDLISWVTYQKTSVDWLTNLIQLVFRILVFKVMFSHSLPQLQKLE